MTMENQTSKKAGFVGTPSTVAAKTGATHDKTYAQKQDAAKLAEFVTILAQDVPSFETLLSNMRQAAALGLTLPKALRVYKRADGDYGVISSKADLADKQKFSKSLAFRKRYEVASEDLMFAAFGVWDYQQQNDAKEWVSPSWTSSPEDRRLRAIQWVKTSAHCADEVASFGA